MGRIARPKHDCHMVQLDGLRAFAVLGVFAQHTLPEEISRDQVMRAFYARNTRR
jgi:peptidoglycan/LPS O-acetylase OafA/YrhL